MRKIPRRFMIALCPLLLAISLTSVVGRYQDQRRIRLSQELRIAVESFDTARAVHLLQLGANPNIAGYGGSPLIFSINQDSKLLRAFLETGANPNARRNDFGSKPYIARQTLLVEWAGDENLEALQLLLRHGANANLDGVDILGQSAGSCGVMCFSHPETVLFLVRRGARLNNANAKSILQAALNALDTDPTESQLIHIWLRLPFPSETRRAALNSVIHDMKENSLFDYVPNKGIPTINYLKRQIESRGKQQK